jgi:small subunit ribosomal protein S17
MEEASTTGGNAEASAPGTAPQVTLPVEKVLQGRVVSNKMQKTIVVEIQQRKLHRLYKKYLSRTKKIKAHDEKNECGIGDTVRVVESRPLSREKRWRLLEIVEKAK